MFYRTGETSPLRRKPLTAIVSPRSVAWISTLGLSGRSNLPPVRPAGSCDDRFRPGEGTVGRDTRPGDGEAKASATPVGPGSPEP